MVDECSAGTWRAWWAEISPAAPGRSKLVQAPYILIQWLLFRLALMGLKSASAYTKPLGVRTQ